MYCNVMLVTGNGVAPAEGVYTERWREWPGIL